MKDMINSFIENEEYEIERLNNRIAFLKTKWFKTARVLNEIEASNKYIALKKELISKLTKI